jgi:hypothetical protein
MHITKQVSKIFAIAAAADSALRTASAHRCLSLAVH